MHVNLPCSKALPVPSRTRIHVSASGAGRTLSLFCRAHLRPSASGSCTSTTSTNFSSMGPSRASPGASSSSGVDVSTVVLTNASHLLLAATLCAYEQQKTYMSATNIDSGKTRRLVSS